MRSRRGFTLVEVLIALGLLVLIASLVLPVALTRTAGARATTVERIFKLSPNTARVEAQRLGLPVALVLLPGEDGRELRLALVRQPDPESDGARDRAADPEDISTWPTVEEPRLLPRGTRLWSGKMDELEAFEAAAGAGAGAGAMLDGTFPDEGAAMGPEDALGEPVDPVVLAWFLSDGSAMAGGATAVWLADGRVVRVRVEALTGRLAFTAAPELEGGGEDGPSFVQDEHSQSPAESGDAQGPSVDGGFEDLGFEDLGFEDIGFEQVEFDDLSTRFDRGQHDQFDQPDDEPSRDPPQRTNPGHTNPQPPQPR